MGCVHNSAFAFQLCQCNSAMGMSTQVLTRPSPCLSWLGMTLVIQVHSPLCRRCFPSCGSTTFNKGAGLGFLLFLPPAEYSSSSWFTEGFKIWKFINIWEVLPEVWLEGRCSGPCSCCVYSWMFIHSWWMPWSHCWLMDEWSSIVWEWLLVSVKEEDFVSLMKGWCVYMELVINVLLYRFRSCLLLWVRNGQSKSNMESGMGECDSVSRSAAS